MDKRSNAGAGMAYSEKKKAYNEEYTKANYRRFSFRVTNSYYENILEPAINASGESANAFIKKAIDERIERLNR